MIAAFLAIVGLLVFTTIKWADRQSVHVSAVPSAPLSQEPINPHEQQVVLVIGDSFTAGSGMNTGPEWPTILAEKRGLVVYADAVGGTGYIEPGPTRQPFASRLPADIREYVPDVVLIAGGRNDVGVYPASQIAAAAQAEVDRVVHAWPNASVVLFSPFASGVPDAATEEATRALAGLAQREGVQFLDVSHFLAEDEIGSDGVHPDNAGHRALARQIGAGLGSLGVLD